MASAGWRKRHGCPIHEAVDPPVGRSAPARMSNSSSWPWPSSATTPRTSPGKSSNETSSSFVRADRPLAEMRAVVPAGLVAASARASMAGASSTPRPSISSTIRSSDPSVTSTTPTVTPSRRTVARSQTAAISIIRWEMKMTERSPPRCRPTTSSTRSVRFAGQGGSHLVEHEHVGFDRQGAREIDDPLGRRQWDVSREARRGRVARGRAPPSSVGTARCGVSVRRRLDRMSRSGMRAGSW